MEHQKITRLRNLILSGQFHHADWRNVGTVREAMWIWQKDLQAPHGCSFAMCFSSSSPDVLSEANELLLQYTRIR